MIVNLVAETKVGNLSKSKTIFHLELKHITGLDYIYTTTLPFGEGRGEVNSLFTSPSPSIGGEIDLSLPGGLSLKTAFFCGALTSFKIYYIWGFYLFPYLAVSTEILIPGMKGTHPSLIFRKLFRNLFLSFITVLCLSTGMVTILIVSLWIRDEMSYDRFHPSYENIYRLTVKVDDNEAGYHSHFARSYYPWLYEIKDKVPGIDEMARLSFRKNHIIMTPEKETFRTNIVLTDPAVFKVFRFNFLKGTPDQAFEKPFSLLLTAAAADKYFGDADPIGKVLEVYCDRCVERVSYTVTGVVEDYPANSHFHFDMLGNIENPESFSDWAYYYVKLEDNTSAESVTENFSTFAANYLPEDYLKNITPDLQPVSDIHLKSHKDREIEEGGNHKNITLFLGLSVFVLAVALFNFINVRQVSLIKYSKTILVMRIHGASRMQLILMQLSESLILGFIALTCAVCFVMLMLPAFNRFTGKDISLLHIWSSSEWYLILSGLLIVAVFSGIYPFLYSGFSRKLMTVFSGGSIMETIPYGRKFGLTRLYLALQFTVSLILIITVLIVNRQIEFFMSNRLGSGNEKEKILCIHHVPAQVLNNYQIFKADLLANPIIKDVTSSFESPADENMDMMPFETIHVSDEIKEKLIFVYPADDGFFDFYNIKLLAGKRFPPYNGNDSMPENYILNKKACEFLGWKPEEAVDKPFTLKFITGDKNIFNGGRIIGVVEDFQMSSMKNEIKPYVFFQKSFWMESVQVKFDESHAGPACDIISEGFIRAFPGFPMQYDYVEDLYSRIYKNENQLRSLSLILGFLAILLSSLGLWGITGIIYQARTKEIGIRKVNGASTARIVIWLLKDVGLIVSLSALVGIPVAYLLMQDWLYNYPLRISMELWMFVLPALFMCVVAILTVFWQANKAASMNPVESLRYE